MLASPAQKAGEDLAKDMCVTSGFVCCKPLLGDSTKFNTPRNYAQHEH